MVAWDSPSGHGRKRVRTCHHDLAESLMWPKNDSARCRGEVASACPVEPAWRRLQSPLGGVWPPDLCFGSQMSGALTGLPRFASRTGLLDAV